MSIFKPTKTTLPTTTQDKSRSIGTGRTTTAADALNLARQLQKVRSTTTTSSTKDRQFGYKDPKLLKGLEGLLGLASKPIGTSAEETELLNTLMGDVRGLAGLTDQEGYVDAIGRPITKAYSDALNRQAHLASGQGYSGITQGAMGRADSILARELGDAYFRNRLAISTALGNQAGGAADLQNRLLNRPIEQFGAVAQGAATAPFTRSDVTRGTSTSTTDTLSNILSANRNMQLGQKLTDTLAESESEGKGTKTVTGPSKAKTAVDIFNVAKKIFDVF